MPVWSSVVVVCAHPDDESFGLGAVLSRFAEAGCRLGLLCFTHGEASTLHDAAGELHAVRADELAAASAVLGVDPVRLLDYPDGGVAAQDVDELADHVIRLCSAAAVAGVLVFDEGGVTGHPDHRTATAAAVRAADELVLPVLAWTIPAEVARRLNDEFGTRFVGRRATNSTWRSRLTGAVSWKPFGVIRASRLTIRCCGDGWSCSARWSTCAT